MKNIFIGFITIVLVQIPCFSQPAFHRNLEGVSEEEISHASNAVEQTLSHSKIWVRSATAFSTDALKKIFPEVKFVRAKIAITPKGGTNTAGIEAVIVIGKNQTLLLTDLNSSKEDFVGLLNISDFKLLMDKEVSLVGKAFCDIYQLPYENVNSSVNGEILSIEYRFPVASDPSQSKVKIDIPLKNGKAIQPEETHK